MVAWMCGLALLAGTHATTRAQETVAYSSTLSLKSTGWTNSLSMPQFDASYGTLVAVSWTVSTTFRSDSRIESLDSVARPGVVHGATGVITLWHDGLALTSTSLTVRFTNNFAAYDGISDFAGSSGISAARRTASSTATDWPGGSLAWYQGSGHVQVPVSATAAGFATGLNNYLQQVRPDAGVTVTVTYSYTPVAAGATIGDLVWNDLDGNGHRDSGEPGLAGVTLSLLHGDLSPVTEVPPTTTDASGYYNFTGVPAGHYLVVVEPPVGFVATYDRDGIDASYAVIVDVNDGDYLDDVDFGFAQLTSTVGDRVWSDDNGNGIQDTDETGLDQVTVELLDGAGVAVLATTQTDSNGTYGFTGLAAGTYRVRVSNVPAGYSPSFDADGIGTPNVATFSLAAGAVLDTLDFGYEPLNGSLKGLVWQDRNRDGAKQSGEPRLAGVLVRLMDTTGTTALATANTAADGSYGFGGLAAGHYLVVVTPPGGYAATYDADGIGTVNQTEVTLSPAEVRGSVDFGYSGGSLGDRVWNDANGDGIQDPTEAGLPGATVTLSNGATTTTDANGFYGFDDLAGGHYTVTVSVPAGWIPTGDVDGVASPGVSTVTLTAGTDRTDVDFGYQERDASVGDRVWRDDNGNGVQDGGEPGLAGIGVTLLNSAGSTVLAATVTDANGYYSFGQLPAGTYTVTAAQPAHHLPTYDADGNAIPNSARFTLAAGEARNDIDFGYQPLSSIGSLVWLDLDADGNAGLAEPGLSGIAVTASGTGGVFTTVTDDQGVYAFADLPPGTYTVAVTVPPGLIPTFDADGISTPNAAVIVLAPTVDRLDVDFGYAPPANNVLNGAVGGVVWNDANGNGGIDGIEGGLGGLGVALFDGNGVRVATAVTDATGGYLFGGLVADYYTVVVNAPTGMSQTFDPDGLASPNEASLGIAADEQHLDIDFGYRQLPPSRAQISGFVWDDTDANGTREPGEAGLGGLPVNLLAAGGAVVATATTDGSGAYRFSGVIAGNYTVTVAPPTYWGPTFDADGTGTPNAVAVSVVPGQNLTGVNFGYQYAPPPGSIGDRVWVDANGNGQQDAGESGLPGVTVTLVDSQGAFLGSVVTDAGGIYSFLSLPNGTYTVSVTAPVYYVATYDRDGVGTPNTTTVTVDIGQDRSDIDFGLRYSPPPALIGDRVWNDLNSNGVQDNGEVGLGNLVVTLQDANNIVVATTTTDANGLYAFPGLAAGSYAVNIVPPAYFIPTYDLDGIGTANRASLNVAIGETNRSADFGLVYAPPLGSIGDRVWQDLDSNGIQDAGEPGLAGVTVTLTDASNAIVATATTDGFGHYEFSGLSAQTYRVKVTVPATAVATYDLDGIATPGTASVPLAIGQDRTDVDFGFHVPTVPQVGSIGDLVWQDLNGNGTADAGETGLTNVPVTLRNGLNVIVGTTVTDSTGHYLFPNLPADSYTVSVVPPANYFASSDLDGITTPNAATLLLVAGQDRTDVDFGYAYIAPAPQVSVVGDLVWSDNDGNGVRDIGEAGLANVTVQLRNGAGTLVLATTTTDPAGSYRFPGISPGQYRVTVLPPANYTPTHDADGIATANSASFTVLSGVDRNDIDFGYMPPSLATVGDRVWIDANSNGIQDAGELGLANVPVVLRDSSGTQVAAAVTGADGHYVFGNLVAGTYRVSVTPPANYGSTYDVDGLGTPNAATVTLAWGETRLDVDFGYVLSTGTASIGDLVWVDSNGNGLRDSGESGLPNATVQLFDNASGTLLSSKVTDSHGSYKFTGLFAGTYIVSVTPPSGYTPTYDLDGLATPNRTVVALGVGQGRSDVDFGYMASPQNGLNGGATGSSPGYWSHKGLSLVRPTDLAVLSALRLVEDNGADADFTNPTTGAFGGAYCADLAAGQAKFGAYEAKATSINMASQLSRQLAAFVLDMRFGEFATTRVMDCSVVPGGKITATDLIALADSALRANSYTPTGDPNRAYQEAIKNALETGYNTYSFK